MWRLAKKCCDNGLLVAHRVRRNLSNVVTLKVELFLSHGSILSHRLRLLFFRQRLSYGKLSSAKKEWFLGRHSDEKWQNMIAADGKLMAATCIWLLTLHVLVSASTTLPFTILSTPHGQTLKADTESATLNSCLCPSLSRALPSLCPAVNISQPSSEKCWIKFSSIKLKEAETVLPNNHFMPDTGCQHETELNVGWTAQWNIWWRPEVNKYDTFFDRRRKYMLKCIHDAKALH